MLNGWEVRLYVIISSTLAQTIRGWKFHVGWMHESYGRSYVTIPSRPIQLYARIQSCSLSEETSHTGLRARDHYTSSTLIGGKGEAGPSCFTLRLRDQQSMWMQDGCKDYMASHGPCFMVTWTISKNHLVEVGPTQNRETMALRTLMTVDLFHFMMREDPHA